ncbi:ATP-grasp domain-containing protein [Vibrio sp. 10N.222.49.A3]|uniref:ATP-grasp domain-containing protein n=1 Tax=Vibrio sp. 10N.222.49.A3 TaxID=3229611 RepID=UPI003550EF9B
MSIQTKFTQRSILIIEPMGAGGELLLKAVKEGGFKSIVATTEEVYSNYLQHLTDLIDIVVFVDFSEGPSAVNCLVAKGKEYTVSGVVVAWEFLTDVAAEVAYELNLPGPDVALAKARRNKFVMQEVLGDAGCRIPKLIAKLSRGNQLTELHHEELNYPVVVKPAENAASFGVSVVSNYCDFPMAIKNAGQWTHEYPHGIPFSDEILVQEYIPGNEFSVEAVSINGKFCPWGVTMKFTTTGSARAETGHIFPAPIPKDLQQKILSLAEKATRALGVSNGISHTEIKLDKNGEPTILESCPRPAGDYIPKLVALATNENPLLVYVKQSAGCLDVNFSPSRPIRYVGISFLRPNKEGTLKKVTMCNKLTSGEILESRVTVNYEALVSPGSTNIERIGWAIMASNESSGITVAMDEFIANTEVCIA